MASITKAQIVALSKIFKKGTKELDELLSYKAEDVLLDFGKEKTEEFRNLVLQIEKEIRDSGLSLITYWDCEYPEALRGIDAPPVFLFVKGNLEYLSYDLFAVVGTRKMSSYGKQVTEQFTKELSKHFVIVSGMASGVDSAAHLTALRNKRPTIAVLGCGINYIYPKSNKSLYEEILKNGCIVSEYLPWEIPKKYTFIARNRIISGLSQGVLVTEASIDSGALITAKFALEQGRDVFAVPGDIHRSLSEGTNYLIQNGAYLVKNPSDLLEYYGFKEHQKLISLSDEEKEFLNVLDTEKSIEDIAEILKKSISEVLVNVTVLELKGLVYKTERGTYSRTI
ncbi:MAG: DNA-processing protein DprA [Fervidobacterium sp.]